MVLGTILIFLSMYLLFAQALGGGNKTLTNLFSSTLFILAVLLIVGAFSNSATPYSTVRRVFLVIGLIIIMVALGYLMMRIFF
jgi:hypothetical protein